MKRVLQAAALTGCAMVLGGCHSHNDNELNYDLFSLSVTETRDVANDRMTVIFTAEETDSNAAEAAQEVNATTQWAFARLKGQEDVKFQTLNYSTTPVYEKQLINKWRVTQTLQLEGEDFAKLSTLTGLLQEKLMVTDMRFGVSKAQQDIEKDQLIEQALKRFNDRAKLIQTSINAKSYTIVDVNINSEDAGMPVMYRKSNYEMMAVSPAIESGNSTLGVTVSGQIQLQK